MMKFLGVFLLLSCIFPFHGASFEISVSANFEGAQGREVRLMEYVDQITYREREVSSTLVDENGHFSFNFTITEPQYIFFRIDHARMGMFIEPGQTYHLQFEPMDFSQLDDRINPYLNPWYFEFTVEKPGNSLNASIGELDDFLYEEFSEHFRMIQQGRNTELFEKIKQQADSLFAKKETGYFKDYKRYIFAYYKHAANLGQFNTMVQEYILNQPVLYHNTQYMNFFNTLFDTYIFAGSRSITISDLRHTINNLNSYHALMDSLGKDTLLRNEVLREIVMLKGLQDMHGNQEFIQSNIESILSFVESNSKFPQHRSIAGNILYQMNHLRNGTAAPSFSVADDDGNIIHIPEDFKGKFLLIGFWATWCESCFLDFVALNDIYAKHSDDLAIVNISTDRHKSEYLQFKNMYNHPWLEVHFNNDFSLLDTYQVRSIPAYVLIDRDGNVIDFPAKRPSDDLITRLQWLLHRENQVVPRQ